MADEDGGLSAQQLAEDQAGTRELFQTFEFGLEVKQFLRSKIGLYVQERAQSEMYEASMLLVEADPTKTHMVIKAQTQYRVAAAAMQWLSEALQAGHVAEQQLLERDG